MRLAGLDRLRAAALLLMVVQHVVEWLSGDARAVVPGWRWFIVTDLAAPAFAVAAGASLHLFLRTRRPSHRTVLRRYGLLVPIGVALGAVVFRHPTGFGVLECLGLACLVAYVLDLRLPPVAVALACLAALLADQVIALVLPDLARGSLVYRMLRGTFPLPAYVGFVLIGALGARALGERDRPAGALVLGGLLAAATALMAFTGDPPDRYPATPAFIVPGLAGTFLLYGALARLQVRATSLAGRLLQGAGAHTLGIFVAHYGVYLLLQWTGVRLAPAPALAAAVVTAAAFALVAPSIPALPWSPRRGRQRGSPPAVLSPEARA